jgi:putative solute:sodium symporter small subunit
MGDRSTPDFESEEAEHNRLLEEHHAYWRVNLRVMAVLLAIWAVVSYGCGILFVEQLNRFHLGGFPVGFWFAQQGSIYVFVVLILVYAKWMDRIDQRFEVD